MNCRARRVEWPDVVMAMSCGLGTSAVFSAPMAHLIVQKRDSGCCALHAHQLKAAYSLSRAQSHRLTSMPSARMSRERSSAQSSVDNATRSCVFSRRRKRHSRLLHFREADTCPSDSDSYSNTPSPTSGQNRPAAIKPLFSRYRRSGPARARRSPFLELAHGDEERRHEQHGEARRRQHSG